MMFLNEPLWHLCETFYSIYRKYRLTVIVQVVSVTLLQTLDPDIRSGSGATEKTIGLELLLFVLAIRPDRRVDARTGYTLLRRPLRALNQCTSHFDLRRICSD